MNHSAELSRISRGPSLELHFDKGRLAAQGWGGVWYTREKKDSKIGYGTKRWA